MLKVVAEPREPKSYCTEQLREPLGSLEVQVKSQRAEGCRRPRSQRRRARTKARARDPEPEPRARARDEEPEPEPRARKRELQEPKDKMVSKPTVSV